MADAVVAIEGRYRPFHAGVWAPSGASAEAAAAQAGHDVLVSLLPAAQAEADAVLSKLKAAPGDTAAYQYATIDAQWGQRAKALEWLETALRLRDPGLIELKTDQLLDPLRKEPRFQAIERELKFPS
jgi:hypothetical protein